jgi:hypothetical protein
VRGGGGAIRDSCLHVVGPCSVENNLLESFNLGANLPRSNIATTKSMLTLLLLLQIEGGCLIQD